jgi:hypothetical protein
MLGIIYEAYCLSHSNSCNHAGCLFVIAAIPVEVLGCRTRGLIALLIALFSGLAALGAAIIGLKGRMRGDIYSIWWVASSLILTLPVIALIILA